MTVKYTLLGVLMIIAEASGFSFLQQIEAWWAPMYDVNLPTCEKPFHVGEKIGLPFIPQFLSAISHVPYFPILILLIHNPVFGKTLSRVMEFVYRTLVRTFLFLLSIFEYVFLHIGISFDEETTNRQLHTCSIDVSKIKTASSTTRKFLATQTVMQVVTCWGHCVNNPRVWLSQETGAIVSVAWILYALLLLGKCESAVGTNSDLEVNKNELQFMDKSPAMTHEEGTILHHRSVEKTPVIRRVRRRSIVQEKPKTAALVMALPMLITFPWVGTYTFVFSGIACLCLLAYKEGHLFLRRLSSRAKLMLALVFGFCFVIYGSEPWFCDYSKVWTSYIHAVFDFMWFQVFASMVIFFVIAHTTSTTTTTTKNTSSSPSASSESTL